MDAYFNAKKITYEKLKELLKPLTVTSNHVKSVNIFINMDDFIHKIHHPYAEDEFKFRNKDGVKQFISNVFNFASHYRYFMACNGWDTKVFVYWTSVLTPTFRNMIYTNEYRKYYLNILSRANIDFQVMNETIADAMPLASIISRYADGVYIIDSKNIEPSVLPRYIDQNINKADWNFIISKDAYDFQYVDFGNWTILYPKKNLKTMEDESYAITGGNLWECVCKINKLKPLPPVLNFDTAWYTYVYSVMGDEYRCLPKIKRVGWKKITDALDVIQRNTDGMSKMTAMYLLVENLAPKTKNGDNTLEVMKTEIIHKCVDVELQLTSMSAIDTTVIDSQITDIPDYENLTQLSRIYLDTHKIDIDRLILKNGPDPRKYTKFGTKKTW